MGLATTLGHTITVISPTVSDITPAPVTPAAPSSSDSSSSSSSANIGAIVGGVVGGLAVIAGAVVGVVFAMRGRCCGQDPAKAHTEQQTARAPELAPAPFDVATQAYYIGAVEFKKAPATSQNYGLQQQEALPGVAGPLEPSRHYNIQPQGVPGTEQARPPIRTSQ
jgi:hypothetical protein